MYIRPLSDIHNEFSVYNLPVTEFDDQSVLILAGDIAVADAPSTLRRFLDTVVDRFPDILYIPGNHEYYHGSLRRVDDKLSEICKEYPNVEYMNQRTIKLGDTRFIGATLWTDYRQNDPMVMLEAESAMNDYVQIRTGIPGQPYQRTIKARDIFPINIDHRAFIRSELLAARTAGDKAVVFTHHGPSFMSRPGPEERRFKPGLVDYAYYNTGLEEMIEEMKPALWIHGHSHYPVDYMIGETRVLSNPRGYSKNPDGSERSDFSSTLVVAL